MLLAATQSNNLIPLLIAAPIIAVFAILASRTKSRRRESLRVIATEFGLDFDPRPARSTWDGLRVFAAFREGTERSPTNRMTGTVEVAGHPCRVELGDYQVTHHSETRSSYRLSYLVLNLPDPDAPDLVIRPDRTRDHLVKLLGFSGPALMIKTPSGTFAASGRDAHAVEAALRPRALALLRAAPHPSLIEVRAGRCCVTDARAWEPADFIARLKFAVTFAECLAATPAVAD